MLLEDAKSPTLLTSRYGSGPNADQPGLKHLNSLSPPSANSGEESGRAGGQFPRSPFPGSVRVSHQKSLRLGALPGRF